MIEQTLEAVTPILVQAATGAVSILVPWLLAQAVRLVSKKASVEANIEDSQMRERLTKVIDNGVANIVATGVDAVTKTAINQVTEYVTQGTPKAMKVLKPDAGVLEARIATALVKALAK